VGPNFYIFS